MADAARISLEDEGEIRSVGVNHVVALALFAGIGIVVGTFGDQ
jgi:hypothetical protein